MSVLDLAMRYPLLWPQARFAHPNAGGDRLAWDRLSAAYELAKVEKGAK